MNDLVGSERRDNNLTNAVRIALIDDCQNAVLHWHSLDKFAACFLNQFDLRPCRQYFNT